MGNLRHFAWVIIDGCKQFLISLNHSIISSSLINFRHFSSLLLSRLWKGTFNKKELELEILSPQGEAMKKILSHMNNCYRNIWNSIKSTQTAVAIKVIYVELYANIEKGKRGRERKMNCYKPHPSSHSIFFFFLLPAITHSSLPMFNASSLRFLPSYTHIRFGCLVHKWNEMPW